MRRALALASGLDAGLARSGGAPSALHNNCSGKHAGFICVACAARIDHRGYVGLGHPVQREVRAALESLTGTGLSEDQCGIDGCSIPTFAVPLTALAHAFARFGTGQGLGKRAPRRRRGCARPARRSLITSRAPAASAPRS